MSVDAFEAVVKAVQPRVFPLGNGRESMSLAALEAFGALTPFMGTGLRLKSKDGGARTHLWALAEGADVDALLEARLFEIVLRMPEVQAALKTDHYRDRQWACKNRQQLHKLAEECIRSVGPERRGDAAARGTGLSAAVTPSRDDGDNGQSDRGRTGEAAAGGRKRRRARSAAPTPRPEKRNEAQTTCFHCGAMGHMRAECSVRRKGEAAREAAEQQRRAPKADGGGSGRTIGGTATAHGVLAVLTVRGPTGAGAVAGALTQAPSAEVQSAVPGTMFAVQATIDGSGP
ncbi:MAG TPA: CCHC-type zinc finger protein, partial [Lacipirellulaceae bacterium]|nr:CCHC-type zinc finger protein [Lacipirellulaceae bacterium]